jgi:hypothetical protein
MSWEAEQERLTQHARLHASGPEAVFEELKKQGRRSQMDLLTARDEKLEVILLERNEPLINLGLACYCANRDVYKALYKHSFQPARDEADARYKHGLRVGCLSNQVMGNAHIILDYPAAIIGPEDVHRLMVQGDDDEITALLRNPSISEKILEALYTHAGPCATLDQERWARLVAISGKNERLRTESSTTTDSPDMEHYAIHKAIFRLLEIAPLGPVWIRVLYDLLVDLDFQQLATVDSIDGVLSRWAQLNDSGSDGKPFEGYYTSLPLKDEFRCLVAALYGRGFTKSKTVLHGSANSNDVARRCAFYGKAELTAKDMKAAYKRDKDVYVFAALFNEGVYSRRELRTLFEEEHVAGDMYRLYERNFGFVKKKWEAIDNRYADKQPEKPADKRLTTIETATDALTKRVAELAGSSPRQSAS